MLEKVYQNPPYSAYIDSLSSQHNWNITHDALPGITPELIGCYDKKTPALLDKWANEKQPVSVNIVAIPPNSSVLDMPARTLKYAALTLQLIQDLKGLGLNIEYLVLLSPCYINEYCNGGNIYAKLKNAKDLQRLIEDYKQTNYPNLASTRVTLDTGKPITEETVEKLKPKIEYIEQNHPQLTEELRVVGEKHARKSASKRAIEVSKLPLAYLLAHPEAWGYSTDQILYELGSPRRINYMPGSELRYLVALKEIEEIWTPATTEISTILSQQTSAPYIAKANEPKIRDLSIYGGGDEYEK